MYAIYVNMFLSEIELSQIIKMIDHTLIYLILFSYLYLNLDGIGVFCCKKVKAPFCAFLYLIDSFANKKNLTNNVFLHKS